MNHPDARMLAVVTAVLVTSAVLAPPVFAATPPAWSSVDDQRVATTTWSGTAEHAIESVVDRSVAAAELSDLPRVVPPVVSLAGYSRWDRSDPLAQDTRLALYETVRDTPGQHVSGLAHRLAVAESTVRYHARILQRETLVKREKIRGRARLYPVEDGDVAVELTAALSEPATATVLCAVAAEQPACTSELAETVDRSVSTVSYHLDRLEDADLVERERVGRAVVTRMPPPVRTVFEERAE